MKLTKIRIFIASLFCVTLFCLNVHAAPGDLDTSFDGDGKTTTLIGLGGEARDVLIQPDGKIVVTGVSYSSVGNSDISLVRYNTDGSLDTSFGTGGIVFLVEEDDQESLSTAIQADGKLLVVGFVVGSDNFRKLAVFRFNTDGSADTAFGTNGRIVFNFSGSSWGNRIILQPDGKMLIGGALAGKFAVFRLNSDGSLDTSFNSVGYNSPNDPVNSSSSVNVVLLQSDGKIVAAGQTGQPGDTGLMMRFNADGTAEGNFIRTSFFVFMDGAIQTDGKIVLTGRSTYGGTKYFAITRYNADKTLDTRFGNSGLNLVTSLSPIWSLSQSDAAAVAIQPDGRILVGGYTHTGSGNRDFALVRFNTHGFLDVGFGNSGKVLTAFSPIIDEIKTIALQPDGKVVAAGYSNGFASPVFAAARYEGGASNTFPTRAQFDFDGDGRADISVFRPSTGEWFILNSFTSSVGIRQFGISGDVPAPADLDGDARTDFAISRNGNWWYALSGGSATGAALFPWNVSGSPRPGDYTGEGRADLIGYANGNWSRRDSFTTVASPVNFGIAGDKALLGDFDGDAKVDPAIYRPSTGEWWYRSSINNAQLAVRWGISTDIPAPADYGGDFKTDFAVYRPSEGVWYIYNSSNGSYTIMAFGLAEDKPVPADYDGDGKADVAVFRPSTGVWYLWLSTQGFAALQFGVSTDIPIPNAFVP